jgi:hypothetical protein
MFFINWIEPIICCTALLAYCTYWYCYMKRCEKEMAKYFDRSEFICTCGCGGNEIEDGFMRALDEAREVAGVPFNITSGYRCVTHNMAVGGKKGSAHRMGLACDIHAPDSRTRYKILKGLIEAGFVRIGVSKDFIHVDADISKDQEVIWTY